MKLYLSMRMKPIQIVTTIHKDVTERLTQINPSLARQAREVLNVNKLERHIRGGQATKEKYAHRQEVRAKGRLC